MKNLWVLLIVTLVISCNNNERGLGGNNNNDNNNRDGWSSQYKNKVISDCVREAENTPGAKEICACVAGKAEKKYPNQSDADKIPKEEAEQMAMECMTGGNGNNNFNNDNDNKNTDDFFEDKGGSWTERDKRKVYEDCLTEVDNHPEAQSYCNCFAQKIIKKYRNRAAVDRGTKAEGEALGKECLRDLGLDNNDNY